MRVIGEVTGVLRVLNKICPPRSKFWILNPAVLQLESEVSINGDELSIDPPRE